MKNLTASLTHLKGLGYGMILRPTRDWLALLTFSFLLMLVSVAWNLWTFNKVTEGELIGTETAVQSDDIKGLEAVTKLFEARSLEEARYRNEYRFVDPSVRGR